MTHQQEPVLGTAISSGFDVRAWLDPHTRVVEELGVTVPMVGKLRQRFVDHRLDDVHNQPRPGAPRRFNDADVERVMPRTIESKPPHTAGWSTRGMAKATGLSLTAVSRIGRACHLQAHRTEIFNLSTASLLLDKIRGVFGLHLSPPNKAIGLCIDEKCQVQALNRSQPSLPVEPSRPEHHSHDDARHGTTSAFRLCVTEMMLFAPNSTGRLPNPSVGATVLQPITPPCELSK